MQKEQDQTYKIKISLAGAYKAGKTSLMFRQAQDFYGENFRAIIGCDFMSKTYTFGDTKVKAYIWDPSRNERFKSMNERFYKNSHAILICFDLSDKMSFLSCHDLLSKFKSQVDQNCNFYLIGCKSDLKPQVQLQDILDFCQTYNIKYSQTSSKQNYGVHEVFNIIVNQVFSKNKLKLQSEKIKLEKHMPKKSFSCF